LEASVGQEILSELYAIRVDPPITEAPEIGDTVVCILRIAIEIFFKSEAQKYKISRTGLKNF
jgi:hypothetical protein